MANGLDRFDTLVVVMMENRSFDHMLGYLSLPPYSRPDVDGLRSDPAWLKKVANSWKGQAYAPFHLRELALLDDPPHEREDIAIQLGSTLTDVYPLDGFVDSFGRVAKRIAPDAPPAVMGYFTPEEIPITHFFAENYGICDRWFAPLPASTQPNRLMAMSGITQIDGNATFLGFPSQPLVYDWLTDHDVRWRVYYDGMPFFMLMKKWIPEILGSKIGDTVGSRSSHFRSFQQLVVDVQEEDPATFPQVIFIEPKYSDAPPAGHGRDDHPPASISGGQAYLWELYLALTSSPSRWSKTAMIVTYDEHGGFFDHVQPLPLITNPPPSEGSEYTPFVTSGLRVPAMVVSPLVAAKSVFSNPFDHTSILKLIGEKWGGGTYSDEVTERDGVESASKLFASETARADIPSPPVPTGMGPPPSVQSAAFAAAAQASYTQDPKSAQEKFPETWHV